MVMGNLHKQSFAAIWNSPQAQKVREQVANCPKQCWMIGSAAPAMKKRILVPVRWILKNKLKVVGNREKNICLHPLASGS